MTEDTTDQSRVGTGSPWREYVGTSVVVYTLAGSYAARQAPSSVRDAQQVIETLAKLLGPPPAGAHDRVAIYLIDPVAEITGDRSAQEGTDFPSHKAGATVDERAIVRVIRPEASDVPLAWPLVHLLVPRWFGADAAGASVLLAGIAGVIAARTGNGPTLEYMLDSVRSELAAGHGVSLFESPADAADQTVRLNMATSFTAFLIEAFGAAALRQFLIAYDPERRDQAALAAYQRPLAALEEAWLGAVRRRASSGAFRTLFGYLVPLLRPYWKRELEVLILMLLGITYSLTIPLSGKYLVDTVIPSRHISRLLIFVGILLVIYVLNTIIGVRRSYVNNWINQRVLLALQERLFAHLQRLSHNFYNTAKVGDVIARLSNDLQIIQQAMAQVAGVAIYQAMVALAAAVTIVVLSPLLGLLILLVLPLFLLSFLLLGKRLAEVSRTRQQLIGEVGAATQENISAQAVIKAFGLAERAVASYHARLMLLLKATLRLVVLASLFEVSTVLAITLGQIVVLGFGGYQVIEGHMSIGTLLATIGLLPSLFTPVSALLQVFETVQSAAGSIDRIVELLEEPITVADAPDAIALPPMTREVRLENVTFGYDRDRPILRDFNLCVPAGTQIAVVGPSGSGKSTLVNLLLRFWDPQVGRVSFDGHDLREVTLASLRGQIGLVFQDTFVFDTTLRANIAIGKPDADDAEIETAVRDAQLEAYVRALPHGYDTVLGERGVLMSGGQRQRLAIARALLRNPRILVLDEATSALDAGTEREILDALAVLARGRTTISITHRLSLAAMADHIVVLDGGQVVEEGTHASLLATDGLYQRLYQEQMAYIIGGTRARARIEAARLRTIPLFTELPDDILSMLTNRLGLERYGPGQVVVRQGEPGDSLYVINRGQVEVVHDDGRGEHRLNMLDEGDYFGEMALLAGEPRIATVRTTVQTELYSLAQADFNELLEQVPELQRSVTAVVEARRMALAAATNSAAALPA
jgi:ATP-binding cassette subfamily B protein